MADEPAPTISVVLCTYQRGSVIEPAVEGVLDQVGAPPFELVVVVDGSTDDTLERLARWDDDPRVVVVHQDNAGLGAARRAGADAARGRWLVFLDDDDHPHTDWLSTFAEPMDRDEVGLVRCGCRVVRPDGTLVRERLPGDRPTPGARLDGVFLPGTFAARRDVHDAAGGFLAGLGFSLQFELGQRLIQVCRERGLVVVEQLVTPFDYLELPPAERSFYNPQVLVDDGRWLLARHPRQFHDEEPSRGADLWSVVGVNAARSDRWDLAREALWRAVRCDPTNPRRWLRFGGALAPPAGRRVWGHSDDFAARSHRRGILMHDRPVPAGVAPTDPLFLPWRYQQNLEVAGIDQVVAVPVQLSAATPAKRAPRRLGLTDRPTWRVVPAEGAVRSASGQVSADAVFVLDDLLERSVHPRRVLGTIRDQLPPAGRLVLETSPRPPETELGPPLSPRRQVWSVDELTLLLESEGFAVVGRWSAGPGRTAICAALTVPTSSPA